MILDFDFVYRFCVQILCSDFLFRFCIQILCSDKKVNRLIKCAGTPNSYTTFAVSDELMFARVKER